MSNLLLLLFTIRRVFFLQVLDNIQNRFLQEVDLGISEALLEHNLAPLSTRRDIAMLGLIHRVVLGVAPAQFNIFFGPERRPAFPRSLRRPDLRHNRQLHDPMDGTHSNAIQRSCLALIYPYNLLPQCTVDLESVSTFQRHLQHAVKHACRSGVNNWEALFTTGAKRLSVTSFHALFSS